MGVDLAKESVLVAQKWFKENRSKIHPPSLFIVNDVGSSENPLMRHIPKNVYFDVVSCQMSMHYLFESEAWVRQFLTNVSTKLVDGGVFLATTLDATTLVTKLRMKGVENTEHPYSYGNQFYSVQFF